MAQQSLRAQRTNWYQAIKLLNPPQSPHSSLAPCPQHPLGIGSQLPANCPYPATCHLPQSTLSSGSRLSVQSTRRMMQVVLTSGSVFMYISSVVSPLACMGGFLMEDGKLGIQEVNSSCSWEEEGFESERTPDPGLNCAWDES